ncbi:Oidioi.mRNA.OKI2018_I69.YSR.g17190.t1.cds [Oikopleura dioica]|uniref:Oidioi.mRNA.OKI2018_I69.YSR.g17190.t1.cds n=1 Tax=Oikopleura dioica TaxID=34765 RepID=A0ABN7SMN2_OIKDI|nr:Oidioi.mRNA.OKI2018_I69.YSR.g17190.t1.cds [Oikopleura dioica]
MDTDSLFSDDSRFVQGAFAAQSNDSLFLDNNMPGAVANDSLFPDNHEGENDKDDFSDEVSYSTPSAQEEEEIWEQDPLDIVIPKQQIELLDTDVVFQEAVDVEGADRLENGTLVATAHPVGNEPPPAYSPRPLRGQRTSPPQFSPECVYHYEDVVQGESPPPFSPCVRRQLFVEHTYLQYVSKGGRLLASKKLPFGSKIANLWRLQLHADRNESTYNLAMAHGRGWVELVEDNMRASTQALKDGRFCVGIFGESGVSVAICGGKLVKTDEEIEDYFSF